jgi:hypothetical protein
MKNHSTNNYQGMSQLPHTITFRLWLFCAALAGILIVPNAALAVGPVSKLYLTAGDENMNWVVQGASVTNSWTQHNIGEYAIAILNTVRTLGVFGPGSEYTLSGTYTGTNFAYPFNNQAVYDGTTNGILNYTVDYGGGGVYSTKTDWSNPTLLFSTTAGYIGIAYDSTDGTLWLSSFNGNTVEHRSLQGALISSFVVPFSRITCLALDPADDTLWMGSQSTEGTFYQYSKTGVQLSTVIYSALLSQNTLGGEFVVPPAPTGLELDGFGTLVFSNNKTATFNIQDVETQLKKNGFFEGGFGYNDSRNHEFFSTAQITSVTFSSDGNQATFTGNAKDGINRKRSVTFTVTVLANQDRDSDDTLTINVSDGYSATGKCLNGGIFIAPNQ